jgi:hypothetical protein
VSGGEQEQQPKTHNQVSSRVRGPVVQSGSIHGGVHFHTSAPAQPQRRSLLPWSIPLAFLRWLGLGGIGALGGGCYAGLVIDGVISLIDGRTFANHVWLPGLPGLAIVGAGLGALLALLTRSRLLPRRRGRLLIVTLAGLVTVPLALAFDSAPGGENLLGGLFLGGGAAGVIAYVLRYRVFRR